MTSGNPYCQMCKTELCVVCKQKLDNCRCPCPNFVICRYCEVHEKTMPPCDEMFSRNDNGGFGGGSGGFGGGGFGGGGPMGKMMMPLMMMMMFMNKQQAAGRSCQCKERNHDRKDRDRSAKRDRGQSPKSGHPCCCKAQNTPVQPPMPIYPLPMGRPTNPCPQGCCSCSTQGDARAEKCREPINQYFFGTDCNPQQAIYPAPQVIYPAPQASYPPPQAFGGYQDKGPGSDPQRMIDKDGSPNPPPRPSTNKLGHSSPQQRKSHSQSPNLGFSHHKPVDKQNSFVINKI